MNSAKQTEHFVTLFDSHYLPLGLALYQSLEEHARPFHLWVVAMDDACAKALAEMKLTALSVIRLPELETDALRSVKAQRTVAEYCWTLTPFLPSHVLQRRPELGRVTYLDADLFFFQSPQVLLEEFAQTGKHVLITEHAFAPEHAAYARYGRFCVQFMTFRNSGPASRVLRWWQERCLEWCYAREENGKFGDQKYLDDWPQRFCNEVHILSQTERTVAPWNVAHLSRSAPPVRPVFYHFHSLKIVSSRRVVPYYMYYIGRENRWIYEKYIATLKGIVKQMRSLKIPVVGRPLYGEGVGPAHAAYSFVRAYLSGNTDWAAL